MPSFSSSEISSMISSKKYKVKRGDSLSILADKFQSGFPSTKCVNKNSLMDKIYNMNKSAFGGSKDLLFEGKDLDLKFICEYRNNLKFDKTKSEYTFTNEDKLVFAIKGANSFWDDFIKFDRSIGESMKQTFRNSPSSSLPKSLPLPITPKSSSNNKKLMEEIKKNLSGQMITTNQIAEAFLKMTGSSYSSGQVQSLAIRLEKENGACRCSTNAPCMVMKDKLSQLSDKIFEETYMKVPLSSSDKTNLEKGFYKPTKLDKLIFSIDSKHFWSRLSTFSDKSVDDILKIRQKFGYDVSLEGNTIFIPSKKSLSNIEISFSPTADRQNFDSSCIPLLQEIAVHANFLGANIKRLVVTSTSRTAKKQASLMVSYLTDGNKSGLYPTVRSWLYNDKQENGMSYYEQYQKGIITEVQFKQISEELALKHITAYPTHYEHVSNSKNVFDIGPSSSGHSENDKKYFNKSISLLEGKYLSTNTKLYGEDGEKAYHIVLR